MIDPADGWDDDEREVLTSLAPAVEAIQERHASDPGPALLRAAKAEALPTDLQHQVDTHLASSRWSRTLADGLDVVAPDDLDQLTEARIRARLASAAALPPSRSSRWWAPIRLSALAAAAAVVVSVYFMRPQPADDRPQTSAPVAGPKPAPAPAQPSSPLRIEITRPEVRLSAAALTWRSAGGSSTFIDDLEPAVNAFKAGDDQAASSDFKALAKKYPSSFDVLYYQGLSALFSGDAAQAVTSLTVAAASAEPSFTQDVQWFLAVAEQRSERIPQAMDRLTALCGGQGPHGADACAALKQLQSR